MDSTTVLVVGDLHLFALRSTGERVWEDLPRLLNEEEVPQRCVLLGDIFDFSWARNYSQREAVENATQRVRWLVESHPETQFDYVVGNHDAKTDFLQSLTEMADDYENLSVHPYHLQVEEILFVHGDLLDRRGLTPESLPGHRERLGSHSDRGRLLELIYQVLVWSRLEEVCCFFRFFSPMVFGRLRRYVDFCELENVTRIVFGHTHKKVADKSSQGIVFTNLGAPIGFRKFEPRYIRVSGRS